MPEFIKVLFSRVGIVIVVYILIGAFFNTNPPHFPPTTVGAGGFGAFLHSWLQYFISILFWPLALWHPTFGLGKWPTGN